MATVWLATTLCQRRPVFIVFISNDEVEEKNVDMFREVSDNLIGAHIQYVFKMSNEDYTYNNG